MCDQALIPAEGQGAGDLILQLLLVTGGVLLWPVLLASGLHCPQKTPGQSHGGWQLSVELVAGDRECSGMWAGTPNGICSSGEHTSVSMCSGKFACSDWAAGVCCACVEGYACMFVTELGCPMSVTQRSDKK